MRAGLRACSFISSFGASPFGGREGGFLAPCMFYIKYTFPLICSILRTFGRDETPRLTCRRCRGVSCYHLIGMIILPQRGQDCKLTAERCGQVGGRLPVHLVHSATGAAAQGRKKPREAERGSSQGKHPGTHGRTGRPPTERPQPAGADRGRRCYPRGTRPKRGTGRADRRARRPRAKSQHPDSGQHTRGGQPKRPQRGGTRHATNPPRQQTPERATQPSEQGQAGEEPTPKRQARHTHRREGGRRRSPPDSCPDDDDLPQALSLT